ncbi:MAG: exodeoxyribonuclease VII small subunit [Sphingopyxis sp.]|jgi:exodeoxyribonuclease VII small subunit|uniref:exodeoxyribonuclease VII small subunit n=1 Tax=unclassified Sphingopyxis TaxID=2614943 RepID=UPI000730D214|nr:MULTISPECIES: exodeoxyribonuclease VII small subunit [unclassified Sphingopyxis]KTE01395.1 exodeoxyribonuclease VII small subunit [Sphingopyxis sp. H012]KTE07506.1 exodeoxyribonuclease VII small subunit [Sphingopyxis sp. H093]KTE12678.1 exodeoxyribonuclease VII small subunit [Sphingopyxis sp. H053]KTE24843.1 exodeoxyribonuclease VII small subunit [Sphingopyxis sp. H080]KTE31933.1 exodeoxyribonuclease VII small subunit [Sphingopyxis sp. H038]
MTDTPEPAREGFGAADIASLSFEAAMGELETIVRRLESGDVSLEESVTLYERGHALRGHCEARLAAAQARIEQVSLGADGRPAGTTPFGES